MVYKGELCVLCGGEKPPGMGHLYKRHLAFILRQMGIASQLTAVWYRHIRPIDAGELLGFYHNTLKQLLEGIYHGNQRDN